MSYPKYKFLHNDHCESHVAHIRLYRSQSSNAGILFSLTKILWFLPVASLIIQNVMQSAHAYRRFGITAGSDTKYWSNKTLTLYSTPLTIVTVYGLNSLNRERGVFGSTLLTSVRRQLTCLPSSAFPKFV